MKRITYLYAMLGICVFILAGCTTEPPAYRIGPNGTILSLYPYTELDRYQACVPIYPFDENKAFEGSDPSKPILWTFGVNFDVLSNGNPLGCLRLYWRKPDPSGITGTFVPIDGGGILVETCQISPSVSIMGGKASFAGEGHIQCLMNLRDWVQNLSGLLWPYAGELQNFSIPWIHEYANFTMIASMIVSPPGSEPPSNSVRPILYYHPLNERPIDFSVHVVNLRNRRVVTAPVDTCQEEPPRPRYPINRMGFWWYDLRSERGLQYYAENNDGFGSVTMTCSVPPWAIPAPPTDSIRFWIGPATLYIGADSTGSNRFYGSMDGVLIDPVDSKPPN